MRVDAPDHFERVGPESNPDDRGSDQEEDRREHERTHQLIETDSPGHRLLERGEHRPECRPECADPDDCGNRCALLGRLGEISGYVPLLECGCLAGSEGDHPDQEQREPTQLPPGRCDRSAERADQQCSGETDPPTMPAHERRQRDRRERRTERERRAAHPRKAVGPEQVACEQRDHRHHAGHRCLAGHLAESQRPQGAALEFIPVDAGISDCLDHRRSLPARPAPRIRRG